MSRFLSRARVANDWWATVVTCALIVMVAVWFCAAGVPLMNWTGPTQHIGVVSSHG